MSVSITGVSCAGLRNTDGRRGISDPYIVFRTREFRPSRRFQSRPGDKRLPPLRNTLNPSWPREVVTLELGARQSANQPVEISIEVWDSDSRTVGSRYDDLLGYASVELGQPEGNVTTELRRGQGGTCTFSYKVDGWSDAAVTESPASPEGPVSLRLREISCEGLRNADGRRAGRSDPYIKAHLHEELTVPGGTLPGLRRLPHIWNNLNPSWGNQEIEMELGTVGESLTLEVRMP